MNIAIYGRNFDQKYNQYISSLFEILDKSKINLSIYSPFHDFIKHNTETSIICDNYTTQDELSENTDVMISIGGDGTFIEAAKFIGKLKIPIIGFNSGRLGFLASISKHKIEDAISKIVTKKYTIVERTLLKLDNDIPQFKDNHYALNDIAIHKRESSSMLKIKAFINDVKINTYWADGLVLSTPTGSTAYSLSLGGPILLPESKNIVLSPVASHNLTVRPIVLPDNCKITLHVEGGRSCLVSLDNNSIPLESGVDINISLADFTVNSIILEGTSFFKTIRNKLLWGVDKRN